METKKEIIIKIEEALNTKNKAKNSMGNSESWYNNYYMLGKFLKENDIDIKCLSKKELNLLLELAYFAGEMFY